MKIFKNKKAEEGPVGLTGSKLVGLIVIALLILLVIVWYSGLANTAVQLIKSAFNT